MRILKKWQAQLHDHFLMKQLSQMRRNQQTVAFDKAQSVGLLFDATELNNRNFVQAYAEQLKNKGKKVKLLAFLDETSQQSQFPFTHFSRKEVDWMMRPKGDAVETFVKTPFDYLINLYLAGKKPLEYISILSQAHLKVGTYPIKHGGFDLVIEMQEEHHLSHFVKQLDYFLKRLNSNQKHEGAII